MCGPGEWFPSAQNNEEQSREETPKAALSLFSSEAIIPKDYGALFDFGNISSIFRQAEGELLKSLRGLGNRDKEETRIERGIKNIKLNEDKIMQLVQDLREQKKGSDPALKEGKPRSSIEEDWPEDEIMTLIRKGWEPS